MWGVGGGHGALRSQPALGIAPVDVYWFCQVVDLAGKLLVAQGAGHLPNLGLFVNLAMHALFCKVEYG